MGRLQDQSILLTGGVSGLGRAIVRRFVQEGAMCTVLDNSDPSPKDIEDYGEAVKFVKGDVREAKANDLAVEAAVNAFGKLDCFVGNAGVWDFNHALKSFTGESLTEGFHELMGINVLGYLQGARAAREALSESGGNIIFTLSNAAKLSNGGGVLYTASKHAGVGVVTQLAFELAPKIRVNAIAPGAILTGLTGPKSLGLENERVKDIGFEAVADQIVPLGRIPTVDEYVPAYVFLASRSETIPATGMVLNYDGGLSIRGFMSPNGESL